MYLIEYRGKIQNVARYYQFQRAQGRSIVIDFTISELQFNFVGGTDFQINHNSPEYLIKNNDNAVVYAKKRINRKAFVYGIYLPDEDKRFFAFEKNNIILMYLISFMFAAAAVTLVARFAIDSFYTKNIFSAPMILLILIPVIGSILVFQSAHFARKTCSIISKL